MTYVTSQRKGAMIDKDDDDDHSSSQDRACGESFAREFRKGRMNDLI